MGNKDSRFKTPQQQPREVSTSTVSSLKLEDYMGLWYEIASIPTFFSKDCGFSSAVYQLTPDGTRIFLTNYCWGESSKPTTINGIAAVENSSDPGKLLVQFEGVNELGHYWIYDTDYKSYAIVGGGDENFLWILARKPRISSQLYGTLIEKILSLGYDTRRLVLKGNVIS